MKKVSKTLAGLSILTIAVGLSLTGCGTASTGSNKPVNPSTTANTDVKTAENKDEASTKDVKLKFSYWGSPVEKTTVEGVLKKFTDKTGIQVEPLYIPNADYLTKITAMIASNDSPDVGYMPEQQALDWAEQGKLLNLNDFFAKDKDLKKEDFIDSVWYTYAPGKVLGTSSAGESFCLQYNADAIKEAGVETPPTTADQAWDWDKFLEVAKKLTIDQNGKNATEADFNPKKIKQYGVTFESGWYGAWFSMVQSNGGDYLSVDGTKFGLTDPAATEAIQKMADLINVYHVAPSPVAASSMPAPAVALQSRQVAMFIQGQWTMLDLGKANFNFGVGVLPKLKKSTTMVLGSPTVIFEGSKNADAAWELYKFFANPEGAIDLMSSGLWMPLLKEWYTNPELVSKWADVKPGHPDGYKDAVMKQTMDNGLPAPTYYVKNFGKLDSIVGPALDQVWLGKKSAQQAMDEIKDKAQAEVKGRYDAK